ncbi:MAG: hypothetical protein KatS3mg087_2065 [Patescibacteria group bacterium]|nr:MAG: hypothetical protein KatS3mg087_2065 [Patescibacteria group bacterium]
MSEEQNLRLLRTSIRLALLVRELFSAYFNDNRTSQATLAALNRLTFLISPKTCDTLPINTDSIKNENLIKEERDKLMEDVKSAIKDKRKVKEILNNYLAEWCEAVGDPIEENEKIPVERAAKIVMCWVKDNFDKVKDEDAYSIGKTVEGDLVLIITKQGYNYIIPKPVDRVVLDDILEIAPKLLEGCNAEVILSKDSMGLTSRLIDCITNYIESL